MKRSLPLALAATLALSAGCAALSGTGEGDLHGAVVQRLALEPRVDQSRLTVRERNGVVSIGGFVSTLEEQRGIDQAVADIRELEGVRRVDVNVSMTAGN